MKKILFALLIAQTFWCPTLVVAQTKKVKLQSENELVVPFDASAQALLWTGSHSVASIMAGIKNAKFEKDEYETSEAYASRTSDVTLLGSIKTDSVLAFQLPLNSTGAWCNTKYGADTQVLSVECRLGQITQFFVSAESSFVEAFGLLSKITTTKKASYIGTNAYGVEKAITARHSNGIGLAIRNLDYNTTAQCSNCPREFSLVVPNITPAHAKLIRGDLGFLFVVKLEKPFLLQETKIERPTLTDPYDFKGEYQFLYGFAYQIWVVDIKRGMVLRRFDNSKKPID